MARSWIIPEPTDVPPALREAVGGHPLTARLLAQRGLLDPQRARAFIDPEFYTPSSPYEMPGMDEAVRLLRQAVERQARVRIWGDFDADGQTSTAVLYEALVAAGAMVDYRLPTRHEGHGLHARAVEEARRDGIAVLITCDTGIGEREVIARGVADGLMIIVTDHHDLLDVPPPAQAIVNPKFLAVDHPLRELSGVGVSYMVARALLDNATHNPVLEQMLDLVALGLVADVVTQVKDVRYLIQRGLAVLRATRRPGVRALVQAANLEPAHVDEADIGYQLGPRLNAAGRLADAEMAVRLLLTQDEREAQALAGQLEALNRDRQARTEAVRAEVEQRLQRDPELVRQPAIVLDSDHWDIGVLGLVAGELAQRYDRPAILIAHQKGSPSAASARSVEGIDIHQAIASQREMLTREGGHPMAAGFAIPPDKLAAFKRGLFDWLLRKAPPRLATPPLQIDADVPWEEVSLDLAHSLERLAPFGSGNPRPVLMTVGGLLTRSEDVSRQRETPHRRLYLDDEHGRGLRFTWFNARELPQVGERVDLAFHVSIGHWHGEERLDLTLLDWRPAAPPVVSIAKLAAGREIVDWRQRQGGDQLLAQLRDKYRETLAVWAEGLVSPPEGAQTRHGLVGRRAIALVVLTPPSDAEALQWVLAQVQPQLVYLLPPLPVAEPTPNEFVKQVAGMLRTALRAHGGRIDALRMAARVGASRAAVVAALRGLESSGLCVLRYEADGLRAYLPEDAPPTIPAGDEPILSEEQRAAARQRAMEQAREALLYLLREMRAFRQAYLTQPVATLFAA